MSSRAMLVAVTTTKPRCVWCSAVIDNDLPTGRRRRYCSQACRQRAYEQRRTPQAMAATGDDAVVISRDQLANLQDRLYVLRCAIDALQDSLDEGADKAELTYVGREVVAAGGDLRELSITPDRSAAEAR